MGVDFGWPESVLNPRHWFNNQYEDMRVTQNTITKHQNRGKEESAVVKLLVLPIGRLPNICP